MNHLELELVLIVRLVIVRPSQIVIYRDLSRLTEIGFNWIALSLLQLNMVQGGSFVILH